jgi:hypothetical protein
MKLPVTRKPWFEWVGIFPMPMAWQGWAVVAIYVLSLIPGFVSFKYQWPVPYYQLAWAGSLAAIFVLTRERGNSG